jgi:hypothetical protein
VVTVAGIFLTVMPLWHVCNRPCILTATVTALWFQVRYSGFRAITAGLQADTYIEAMEIEKHKLGYDEVLARGEGGISAERQVWDGECDFHQSAHIISSLFAQIQEVASDADPYSRLASSIGRLPHS